MGTTRKKPALDAAKQALDDARHIIDIGENRAMACDGPVGHCREELSNTEFDEMWRRVERARSILRKFRQVDIT